jgi:hypothetical protein
MIRLWILVGFASIALAGPGAELAAASPNAGSGSASQATIGSVTKVFAAHGVQLEAHRANTFTLLINLRHMSSQGIVTVVVLKSDAAAKVLPLRETPFTQCTGFLASYMTWRSRNVVATVTRCASSRNDVHVATAPVASQVARAMTDLAR